MCVRLNEIESQPWGKSVKRRLQSNMQREWSSGSDFIQINLEAM